MDVIRPTKEKKKRHASRRAKLLVPVVAMVGLKDLWMIFILFLRIEISNNCDTLCEAGVKSEKSELAQLGLSALGTARAQPLYHLNHSTT
jgi:hypothetical protein